MVDMVADPVTNPLGALSQMESSAPAQETPNPLGALQQFQLTRSKEDADYTDKQRAAWEDQIAKLQAYEPDNAAERWGAIASGAGAVAPVTGNFGQMLASMGGAYGKQQAAAQARGLERDKIIADMREKQLRGLEANQTRQALLGGRGVNGFEFRKNADGTTTAYSKATGQPAGVYGPKDIGKVNQMTQELAKAAFNKGDFDTLDEALAWAQEKALSSVSLMQGATNPTARPTASAPEPRVEVTPTDAADRQKMVNDLKIREDEAVARGDMTLAREMQQARVKIAQAPIINTPMPKLDVAKQEGKKETEKESAKMYATSFEDNVLKPSTAMQNTGKIMQDFNNLGQMQGALKNGKLKEFMAGETGKWAMSLLPESSDLRKGIANAQEAEKLSAGMINTILQAAKGVQTEGDAQRARSQITSIGTDPDANKYLEVYIGETARQLKMREQMGLSHKKQTGNWEGYDESWNNHAIMKEAKGSVKKLGSTWIGLTQYMDKFKAKNPSATDSDAIASWNRI